MNNIKKHSLGILIVSIFVFGVVASSSSYYTVKFSPKESDIFTKENFKNYMKSTPNPTIVVRVPEGVSSSLTKSNFSKNNIYNTVEKELGRKGFVVRDRALFEKVIESGSINYESISSSTNTELILELISFDKEKYFTNKYFTQDGKEKTSSREFTYEGIKVEFRLVKVKENDVVGSYTFHYAPCLQGCIVKSSSSTNELLFGDSADSKKPYEGITQDEVEVFFKECTQNLIKEMEKK